jgi:hypothetical protein
VTQNFSHQFLCERRSEYKIPMTKSHIFGTHPFEHRNSIGKFLVTREMTWIFLGCKGNDSSHQRKKRAIGNLYYM